MIRAALYARVSSDRQEHEETVQSQLAELRLRLQADGVAQWQEFVDEGFSRDTLVRPALDRLRDLAAQDDLDRVYVQSPDRLASGAKLVLVYQELQERGVQGVFLKGAVDETPEGKLLLHVQGAMGEYERTKIAERTRRGRLYWAREGAYMGGSVPYGYRVVHRVPGQRERARLEIDEVKAAVVREIFRWLVEERLSVRRITMRLRERQVPTPRGAGAWHSSVIGALLRNPAYKGELLYHKKEPVEPATRRTTDPYRRYRNTGRRLRPEEEWIRIPVPPLLDEATWEAAQRQIEANRTYAPRNNTTSRYLLKGLIRCPACGGTWAGRTNRSVRIYHCYRWDVVRSVTGERCLTKAVRADPLEAVVWEALRARLGTPETLVADYRRRVAEMGTVDGVEAERKLVRVALRRVKGQQDRLTDAYLAEAMDLAAFKDRMEDLRRNKAQLDRQLEELVQQHANRSRAEEALASLEAFCGAVAKGLDTMSFEERQQLLRLVVGRITVVEGDVWVETIVPLDGDTTTPASWRPVTAE